MMRLETDKRHLLLRIGVLMVCALFVVVPNVKADPSEEVEPDELIEQDEDIGADEDFGVDEIDEHIGGIEAPEPIEQDEDIEVDEDIGGIEEPAKENIIIRKENPVDPCDRGLDSYNYEKSWYDTTQIYVNSKFCEPALWFDNFFADDRVFAEGPAGTYVRWRNEFTYDEEEAFSYKMALSASAVLPVLKRNLRLTFEGDQDESLSDVAPGKATENNNKLGLQLDVARTTRSKFNINITLTPRIVFRYRYTYPLAKRITLRLTQELQNENGVNSTRTLFDFEKPFRQKYLFRASTEGKFSEDYDGMDWLQAFVLFKRLNKKTSFAYEGSVSGITQPYTLATNYRLGVRFRKNFHRKWLFYEISPDMTWPITLDESRTVVEKDRRSKWLIFFRLEVHFGNAYQKRYENYN